MSMVSIVIPFRNEVGYIEHCLAALRAQDYGSDNMEVVAVDGASTDGSRSLVERVQGLKVRVLENPGKITSCGLNIGIRAARGDYILLLGSHTMLDTAYVSTCVRILQQMKADCVGGKVIISATPGISSAIALARSSRIGGSMLAHRHASQGSFVRTVAYGVYRRDVFTQVGLFDEKLVHDQDEELNWRMIKNGLTIYYTPDAKAYYQQKRTIAGLARQLFRYGFWKARTLIKHPDFFMPHFLVPALLVISMAVLIVGGILCPALRPLALIEAASYAAIVCFATVAVSISHGPYFLVLLPGIYVIIHCSLGIGFIMGFITAGSFRRALTL